MSRLVLPRPSPQLPPIRFSADAGREDLAGDRSGTAMPLMKSSVREVGSAIHHAHILVPFPAGRAFRCRLVDPLQVLAHQGDPERGHVLLQVLAALGARDRNDT